MSETHKSRKDTDWFGELKEDEVKQGKNGQVYVPLHALRRLADEAGFLESRIDHHQIIPMENPGSKNAFSYIAGIVYSVRFDDNTEWTGVADAHPFNCDDEVVPYLSSVAESRAEGRALRKALGIDCLTEDEVSLDASACRMKDKVDSGQIKLIEKLMKSKEITLKEILKSCSSRDILTLAELSYEEARAACKFVNDYKKKS